MTSGLKIIGIAGTNGSGKDTVGQILHNEYNYLFVSVTDLLRAECRRRGIDITRENLRTISAEWRRESGLGVLIDKAVAAFNDSRKNYSGLAIASLRNPGEADRVHELGGHVIWVDADPKIRYHRISSADRGRSSEDNKSYEQFLAEEQAEMQASGDAATLDMSTVKTKSDLNLKNESTETNLKQIVASELAP